MKKTIYYNLSNVFLYPLRKFSGNKVYVWRRGQWEDYGKPWVTTYQTSYYNQFEITEEEAFRYIILEN